MVLATDIAIDGVDEGKCVLFPNALYVLPSQQTADALFTLVWCDDCGDLTAGECLDDPSRVQTMINDIQRGHLPDVWRVLFDSDSAIQLELQRLKQTQRFLRLRETPRRCLRCAGTRIGDVETDGDAGVLPNGSTFTANRFFANTSICNRLTILDLGGKAIGEIGRYDINGNCIDCTYPLNVLAEILEDAGIMT